MSTTVYRQRIKSQAHSIRAKRVQNYIRQQLLQESLVGKEHDEQVSADAAVYLERYDLDERLTCVFFPLIKGRDYNAKRSRQQQPEKSVCLPLLVEQDVEILEDYGNVAMVTARIARLLEAACAADASFDGWRLALLFPLSLRALRSRIRELWDQGAMLPLAGTSEKYRRKWKNTRAALACERYLRGEPLSQVREDLLICRTCWRHIWSIFCAVWQQPDGELSSKMDDLVCPECDARSFRHVVRRLKGQKTMRNRMKELMIAPEDEQDLREPEVFVSRLQDKYGYDFDLACRIKVRLDRLAEDLLDMVEDKPYHLLYFAVCNDEQPFQPLREARLKPVLLEYLAEEDMSLVDPQSPMKLRRLRVCRIIKQAYRQGAALSLADVGFILGLSTDAISNVLEDAPAAVVRTRGKVANMEPMLDNVSRVLRLRFSGKDIPEIEEETGYRREAIERYLSCFRKVVRLAKEGEDDPDDISEKLQVSPQAAQQCLQLYREFADDPDLSDGLQIW